MRCRSLISDFRSCSDSVREQGLSDMRSGRYAFQRITDSDFNPWKPGLRSPEFADTIPDSSAVWAM